MEVIEGEGVLHLILGSLGSRDLSRATRVRRAWLLAAEGLWKDVCLVEFPIARAIHALPGHQKSWLQLYGEMTLTRQPRARRPKCEDFKLAVSVFTGKPQKQRLLHTGVYTGDGMDEDGHLLFETITLTEPIEIATDDIFRVDVVVLRAADSKVCATFNGEKGEWEDSDNGIKFCSVTDTMGSPSSAGGGEFSVYTDVFIGTDLYWGEWQRGEMLITSEMDVGIDYLVDDDSSGRMFLDTFLPLLLR